MDAPDRPAPAGVSNTLYQAPGDFDLHQAVRLLCLMEGTRGRRLGDPLPLRFSTTGSPAYQPNDIAALHRPTAANPVPEIVTDVVALTGPQGVLPALYSDAQMRAARAGSDDDEVSLHGFLDLFGQRLAELHHAAWEKTAFAVREERDDPDGTGAILDSLIGLATPGLAGMLADGGIDSIGLRALAALLNRSIRGSTGFADLLSDLLDTPVEVVPLLGRLRPLPDDSRAQLGGQAPLGDGAMLGDTVWDVSSAVMVRVGPVGTALAARLLEPMAGGAPPRLRRGLGRLAEYYFAGSVAVRLEVILAPGVRPPLALAPHAGNGRGQELMPRLGSTAWLDGPGEDRTGMWL
ncbi:MAG: hypothetical protein RLY86_37 [Pseudomonadota bacterium]|jgi:type VI secretion system ImpH/TssG family protein